MCAIFVYATCTCAGLIYWGRCLVDAGEMAANMQAWKVV